MLSRFDRIQGRILSYDPASRRLRELFASYGLSCRVSSPTHDCGGGLVDVVATRADMPISVDVIDPGFSDHRLLRWSCSLQKSAPVYETSTYRPWQRLDVNRFSTSCVDQRCAAT